MRVTSMRSLRRKILALVALVLVLVLTGTISALLYAARHDLQERAQAELALSGAVLERVMHLRASQFEAALQLLSADADFSAAMAADDHDMLGRLLERAATRVGADQALAVSARGQLLAEVHHPGSAPAAVLASLDGTTTSGDASLSLLGNAGRHHLATRIPFGRADGLSRGWLAMAISLDDARAARIARLGGQDLAFLVGSGSSLRLAGSSVSGIDLPALQAAMHAARPGAMLKLQIADTGYLAALHPLLSGNPGLQLLLLRPAEQALAPYPLLRRSVLGTALFGLLLSLAGAALLARTIDRPVRALADAAGRIRSGDYSHAVPASTDDELGMLAATFNTMQTEIAEREARITFQARFDALTGLPNRLQGLHRLADAVARARAEGRPLSLLVIDLGNLGEIIAALGHDIGDALVSQVAERLRNSAEARHTVARLESNEFLVILEGLGRNPARELAAELLHLLDIGLAVHDINISLDAVAGIALYPEHGEDAEQLLLRATIARHDAHKACEPLRFYEDGEEERRVRQLAILGDLRRGISRGELKLYLQPKMSLRDGRLCGAEALVRWEHPHFGWLPPADFIGIIEQFGNISLITRWALETAVRECRLWIEDGLDIPVAVNLSSRDLRDGGLPAFIDRLLRDHDLAPRHLTLELTEEALVQDFSRASTVLEQLRRLGVRISIDDFGTGYSSLAKLKHLPVDELKIDRSFVMGLPGDPSDAAIIQAVLMLAQRLSLEVVAEGVESAAALQWLLANGCTQAQGFHLSRPMPVEAFSRYARTFRGGLSLPRQEAYATGGTSTPAGRLASTLS